jgi:hypothetical protein
LNKLHIAISIGVAVVFLATWLFITTYIPDDVNAESPRLRSSESVPFKTPTDADKRVPVSKSVPGLKSNASVGDVEFDAQMEKDFASWAKSVSDWLIRRGDAQSLVAAAEILRVSEPENAFTTSEASGRFKQRITLLEKAAQLEPDNALIQWHALSMCERATDYQLLCNSDRFVERLQRADPKNGYASLYALDLAFRNNNREAELASLKKMASSDRFDDYGIKTAELVMRSVEAAPVSIPNNLSAILQQTLHQTLAIDSLLQSPLPAFRPLFDLCRADATEDCRQISAIMRGADTVALRGVGIALAQQLASPGSADATALIDERRRLDWLRNKFDDLHIPPFQTNDLLLEYGGEIKMIEGTLRIHAVPLQPPDGWQLANPSN